MNKFLKRLSLTMQLLLIAELMTGCASYKVISSDREVLRVKKGVALTTSHDGWFVPDATWIDINDALAKKLYETNSPSNSGK